MLTRHSLHTTAMGGIPEWTAWGLYGTAASTRLNVCPPQVLPMVEQETCQDMKDFIIKHLQYFTVSL